VSNGVNGVCMDLKKHGFGWGNPETQNAALINGNMSNDNFQQTGVNVELDNKAEFAIKAYLVDTNAKNSDAKHGDVKWTFIITWPWSSSATGPFCPEEGPCSGGSQLCLLAGLDGFGGFVNGGANHAQNTGAVGTAPAGYNFTVQGVTYENGFLSQPTQATCTTSAGMSVIGVDSGHSLKGGKPEAMWCFNYCAGTITYDPIHSPTGGGPVSNGGGNGKQNSNPGTLAQKTGSLQVNTDGSFGTYNGNWEGLQWATLTEYDGNGAEVQSVDLTKTHYGWSIPDNYTVIYSYTTTVSEKMPHTNFTSSLVNGAIFTVDVYYYNVDSVVSSNKRNDIKFTITISNWPWCNQAPGVCVAGNYGEGEGFYSGNTLVLTAGLVGYGGIVRHFVHSGGSTYGNLVEADFTYATLISPDTGLYDNSFTRNVPISYSTSGKPIVTWTFSYFANEVVYDPSQLLVPPTAAESFNYTSPGMITLWAILGLLLVGGLMIAIGYTLTAKKRRPSTTSASEIPL